MFGCQCRCHSGFVPVRNCSGGTFPHARKCSRLHICSASVNERLNSDIKVYTAIVSRMPELKDVPMIECGIKSCGINVLADCESMTNQAFEDSLVDWYCKNRQ